MGKYYSLADGNLYIFVTLGDELLDLGAFPSELNLFEAESDWRISPWLAVAHNVLERSASMAQVILRLNGFQRMNMPADVLEEYFLDGDEERVLEYLRLVEAGEVVELGRGSG